MRKNFLIILLLSVAAFAVSYRPLQNDEKAAPCHDDEQQVTDSRGGYKCVPNDTKPKVMEYSATDCVKDFKPGAQTTLVVPLFTDGSMNMGAARLEHFDFKLVCGVPK